jgi:catechol 2,3-dioxygenase-like lactoylglutathione lyase family enzyme
MYVILPIESAAAKAYNGSRPNAPEAAMPDLFTDTQVTCMLPVKDMQRARRFYEQGLGLAPQGLKPDGKFVYRAGGTELALFPKPEGTKAEHTALSLRVADIAATIALLKDRGVRFADYDFPGLKTVEHVCVLGAEKAAWFEDTEGNILCLHEDLA